MFFFLFFSFYLLQNISRLKYTLACTYSYDLNEGHTHGLFRILVFGLKKHCTLASPLTTHRRVRSDCADAQADQSLQRAHILIDTLSHSPTELTSPRLKK